MVGLLIGPKFSCLLKVLINNSASILKVKCMTTLTCVLWFFNLGIYFSLCLALMVISLLETVIITNVLHHNSLKYREVPKWVRVLVLKRIANLICYHWPKDIQPPSTPQKDKPGNSNVSSGPWIIQPASWAPDQHPVSNGNQTYTVLCHYIGQLVLKNLKSIWENILAGIIWFTQIQNSCEGKCSFLY